MSYHNCPQLGQSFQLVQNAFLQHPGLPFAAVLEEDDIQAAFAAEDALFGQQADDVYTPPLVLWGMLSQALQAGNARSCTAAVARVIVLCVALGRRPPSEDTGAYCRARAKVPEAVLRRLTYQVSDRLESSVPADWRWHGRHVKVVDGTTLSVPDTLDNQAVWPQPRSQQAGLGFPLLRLCLVMSLVTGALCGLELGPYEGKETGETALLRRLLELGRLLAGDLVLGDSYFCSYFMLALLRACGLDGLFHQHQRRKTDFSQGQRLGDGDHLTTWSKPERPAWMDEATDAQIPDELVVRELRVQVSIRGFRVRELILVTTLTDAQTYTQQEIGELYRQRWHVELDLRALKTALHLEDLRGQSPAAVRREIWTHCLAYNLLRQTMAQAALLEQRTVRQLSFTTALQNVRAAWDHATLATPEELSRLAQAQLRTIGRSTVGQRPHRVEPRAVKRRPKKQKLLTQPRAQAREALLNGTAADIQPRRCRPAA